MTARYRSIEKIRVTFTLMPSPITVVIAGRPSSVAGILIRTFGRSTVIQRARACSTDGSVSGARRGSTSMETRPSKPSVASNTGRRMSHASRTSSVVAATTASSRLAPAFARAPICSA